MMIFMIKKELEERRKRYNGGEEETLNPARLRSAVACVIRGLLSISFFHSYSSKVPADETLLEEGT